MQSNPRSHRLHRRVGLIVGAAAAGRWVARGAKAREHAASHLDVPDLVLHQARVLDLASFTETQAHDVLALGRGLGAEQPLVAAA